MDTEWIAVIGTLMGLLVGFLSGLLKDHITYKRRQRDEKLKRRRAKMEELYFAVGEFISPWSEFTDRVRTWAERGVDHPDYKSEGWQILRLNESQLWKLQSMQGLYAPMFEAQWMPVLNSLERVQDLLPEIVRTKDLKELHNEIDLVRRTCLAYAETLAKEIKEM